MAHERTSGDLGKLFESARQMAAERGNAVRGSAEALVKGGSWRVITDFSREHEDYFIDLQAKNEVGEWGSLMRVQRFLAGKGFVVSTVAVTGDETEVSRMVVYNVDGNRGVFVPFSRRRNPAYAKIWMTEKGGYRRIEELPARINVTETVARFLNQVVEMDFGHPPEFVAQ